MTPRKKLFAASLAAVAVVAGGVALASADEPDSVTTSVSVSLPAARPLQADVADRFAAFRDAGTIAARQVVPGDSTLASVARNVSSLPESAIAAHIDLARAISVPITGGEGSVWIAPAGHSVCTIVPDPVDGSGVGCNTLSQIEEGSAVTILGGAKSGSTSPMVVASPVPDGSSPPSVTDGAGRTRTLPVMTNIAAATVSASDTLHSGPTDIVLKVIAEASRATGTPGS